MIDDTASSVDKLSRIINLKAERNEVLKLIENRQQERDSLTHDKASNEISTQFKTFKSKIKEEFKEFKADIQEKFQTKADSQHLIDINTRLNNKADNDKVSLIMTQNKNSLFESLENNRKDINEAKLYIENLTQTNFKLITDQIQSQLNEIWSEVERLQNQRNDDVNQFKNTADQLYEAHQAKFRENEYKKVLKDIKKLGQSLEEIENIMVKEVCSKSGGSNSIIELKQSLISNNAKSI